MRKVSLVPALFVIVSTSAFGQTATILGTVTDTSSGVVPSATITIVNTATRVQRTVETNTAGNYIAPELPIGPYSLKAEQKGFKSYERTGIVLNSNDTVRMDVVMQVGEVSESVTVEADAVKVQSDTSEVSDTISGRQVAQLAINGRHIAALAILTPGASSDLPDFNLPIGVGGSTYISFNGQRVDHNVWMIDGGENYDRGCGGCVTMMPSVDAIAEFTTLTSNSGADFGLGSGGTINLVLKSGVRDLHGAAYELFRNDALDANNYFANLNGSPKPKLRYNVYGFNIGGPVMIPGLYNKERNKTFFFVNAEWRKFVLGSQVFAPAIPQAQRDGDFGSLSSPVLVPQTNDPGQQARFASLGLTPGLQFPGNKIPDSLIDANAKLFFASGAMPLPNALGNNFSGSRGVPTQVPEAILRIDHYFTSKLSLMAHYVHDGTDQQTPTTLWSGSTYPTLGTDFRNPSWSAVVKLTQMISPSLLNETGYFMNGNRIYLTPVGIFAKPAGWGVKELFGENKLDRMPTISIGGSYGVNYDPAAWPWYNAAFDHQVRDDASWTRSSHNFKFGGQFMRYSKNQMLFGNTQGNYNFDGTFTGNAVADFLLGYAKSYNELAIQDRGHWRNNSLSFYGADNWRVNKRLTLNLALRWEVIPHVYDIQNRMSNFYPDRYDPSKAPIFNADGSLDSSGPGFQTVSGVPLSSVPFYLNGIVIAGKDGTPRGLVNNHFNTFAPRIGFAHELTGRGRTVLRGGFGMYYERIQGNDVYNTGPNPPFSFNPSANSVYFSDPSISVINGQKATLPIFPAGITALALNDYKLPTSMQWNLGIQHQLAQGAVLGIAYVGNSDYHQRVDRNINAVQLSDLRRLDIKNGQFDANRARPFPGYSGITLGETATGSSYNALQFNFRMEAYRGLTLQSAYTWSHNIDYGSGDFSGITNPFNRRFDRGPSDLDRRHVLSLNYIYQLPIFSSSSGLAKSIAGGWEISGITLIQSGTPMTPFLTYDNLGIGAGGARPDVTGSIGYPKSVDEWFNPNAFETPAVLSFGSAGRGILRGPGRANFNLSLFKSFTMPFPGNPEGAKLQFRAEAFNAFNHTQFHGVDTGFGGQNFSKVTSTYDPRVWQLGLKFLF
ncbi:MAG: hypothetical protein DMG57_16750 [Acidobacteria bacterium]|nr:MAG: hypothetical protein DMG57_16750 [Acidobacteriota bacterium]